MKSNLFLQPALKFQNPPPQVGPFVVQGKKATSYEWNFAQALDTIKVPYMFQYQLFGGRTLRGGMVLDFLVFTLPLSTPVFVNGDYWHQGQRAQLDYMQQILLGVGGFMPAVILWGKDTATPEDALSSARRYFG